MAFIEYGRYMVRTNDDLSEEIIYAALDAHGDYTLNDLESMATLSEGYTSDEKVDDGTYIVHLNRTGVSSGEWANDLVTIEKRINGNVVFVCEYPAQ